ncbi:MAG: VanZ family protein [Oscillospiraceae bacterium]|nr:VanZ family protein [Oscillospiraceae bacterium]
MTGPRALARTARILLLPYAYIVLRLTLLGRPVEQRRHAFRPFFEITQILEGNMRRFYAGQILGNLLMLVPLGILLPCAFSCMRRLPRTAAAAMLVSCSIEAAQYLTGRGLCETDDVLHNTLGACAGYVLIWLLLLRHLRDH